MDKKMYLLAIILLLITGCGEEKPNISQNPNVDGNEVNVSEKLKEDKYYENYKITESTLVAEDNVTRFKFKVKNVLSTENKGGTVEIVFVNKNNEEISKIIIYIPPLQPNGETYIQVVLAKDTINAYDYYMKMK